MLLLVLTAACSTALVQFDGPGNDSGGHDTADTDTDADSDSDTDADSDTDSGIPAEPDVTYVPSDAGSGDSFLSLYKLAADGTVALDGPSVTVPYASSKWSVSYTPVEADYADGANYVIFVAYVTNGAGAGIGMSEWLTLYSDGPPISDLASLGFVEGWNAFQIVSAGQYPTGSPALDLDMPLNLISDTSLTLSGSYSGTVSASYRLAVYPYTASTTMLYDGSLAPSWSFTLSGRPAAANVYEASGVVIGGGTPFAYKDFDGSRSFTSGDSSQAIAALDSGENVGVIWLDPVADVTAAFTATVGIGLHAGWGAYAIVDGERARELDATELISVRLDP